jgi:hypothetical protein
VYLRKVSAEYEVELSVEDTKGRGKFMIPRGSTIEFQNPTYVLVDTGIPKEKDLDQFMYKERPHSEMRVEIYQRDPGDFEITFRVYIPDPDPDPSRMIRAANLY